MRLFEKVTQAVALAALLGLALMALAFAAGLRLNTSKSIALGVYRLSDAPLQRGEAVLLCPADTDAFQRALERGYIGIGDCPNGSQALGKRIAAMAGDRVSIDTQGVRVNGALWPLSKPRPVDLQGHPLPQIRLDNHRLNENELLLMGDINPNSFDSRYFGLVDRAHIQGVVRPVWTW